MKRFFLIVSFVFLISFLSPRNSYAACSGVGEVCHASALCCSPYTCDFTGHCIGGDPTPNSNLWCEENKTLNTAIGCIPVLSTKEEFLSFILKWAVGIGGGIAFLLIIYAGFMIMTSAGNPERLKAGQELLTSAISGLILLIFSVVILKIIGVDILGLDNFGFN